MNRRPSSLKRPLILQPLALQLVISVITFTAFMAFIIRVDSGGRYVDQTVAAAAAAAVVHAPDGGLDVRMTPELRKHRAEADGLWFIARDAHGHTVTYGPAPAAYAALAPSLDQLAFADIRARTAPFTLSAILRQETGPAGKLTILAHGKVTPMTPVLALMSNLIIAPIFLILALVTVVMTPWIVNRALAGVARIARAAGEIDANQRGVRLPENEAPREIEPLVRAVNEALGRLDEGHDQQQRFIASAAHELRTPIAVLQVKVEAGDDATRRRLAGDVARIANVAEQLLDLHRLENEALTDRIALATLARGVAADLAPLLIASGKTIEVQVQAPATIMGSAGALERVLTNLIQNAVEHGGQHVVVRVEGARLEVQDDGPGIPEAERERVFEPFHRLRPRAAGTGLGLNLVRQVVDLHRGRVGILDAPAGGVIVRVDLPADRDTAHRGAKPPL